MADAAAPTRLDGRRGSVGGLPAQPGQHHCDEDRHRDEYDAHDEQHDGSGNLTLEEGLNEWEGEEHHADRPEPE